MVSTEVYQLTLSVYWCTRPKSILLRRPCELTHYCACLHTAFGPLTKNISVRAEWLHKSGRAPSEPSETPRWWFTPRLASVPRIALHIALRSPFLLALSVSYFTQSLWHCGQLRPYVGMGSLDAHLHWDCNAMGDAAKISPPVPSTLRLRSVGRRWEAMVLHGRDNSRNCVDPRNLGKRKWNQKLRKIDCVFSLYDKMMWKWDAVYLPRSLPNIHSTLVIPPPLPLLLRTPTIGPELYTWRLYSS
jgi:hypothetical protein